MKSSDRTPVIVYLAAAREQLEETSIPELIELVSFELKVDMTYNEMNRVRRDLQWKSLRKKAAQSDSGRIEKMEKLVDYLVCQLNIDLPLWAQKGGEQ